MRRGICPCVLPFVKSSCSMFATSQKETANIRNSRFTEEWLIGLWDRRSLGIDVGQQLLAGHWNASADAVNSIIIQTA